MECITPATLGELDAWLTVHAGTSPSVWLRLAKAGSGRPVLPKGELVKTLLAHGWIDSLPAKLDAAYYKLRISPRDPRSNWSALNKRYVAELETEGRLTERGRAMVELAKNTGTWDALNDVDALVVQDDLAAAFAKTPGSRARWDAFPRSVKRGQLEQVYTAKRPATRAKRIAQVVGLAAVGRRAFFER